MTDSVGRTIPKHLENRWLRRNEFRSAVNLIDTIRTKLESLYKSNDEIWRKVDHTAIERAEQLRSAILVNYPYAVCTECNGWFEQLQGGICPCCNSTGFMSKKQFQQVPEETKALILNDSLSRLSAAMPRQNL